MDVITMNGMVVAKHQYIPPRVEEARTKSAATSIYHLHALHVSLALISKSQFTSSDPATLLSVQNLESSG